ncbi:MAG: FAD-dependent oxidoreductase [Ignavibacteriaceae bacterium]|jgi:sulfide:quinone oxidoreductase
MKKALVIGGGFAGVQAAIELQKTGIFEVTLVSERNYLYLYPISIWIPTGKIPFEKVTLPLEDVRKANKFNLIIDSVESIKSIENKVYCKNNILEYDYLVVALGADKMKHPGIENTFSICGKPEISLEIKERVERLINKGSGKIAIGFGGNPKDKSAVRGGPAFELMFNIHELLKEKGIREHFELHFFAPMEQPGERMGKKSVAMVDSMFASYKIQKHYGKKIKVFEKDGVVFEDESKQQADLILFIPASASHGVLKNSDLPLSEAGFIKIDDNCKVDGVSNVYAAGDIAALSGPAWTAKQGHIAELMARYAAQNIYNSESGIDNRKEYEQHLNILCVMDSGRGAAIVFRNDKKAFVIPLPLVGHWLKQGWGYYIKLTKKKLFPRLPGL